MDTKKISSLLTVIEKGSLTAAAAGLGYTQSGLTHMMNTLEDELGVNLLIRSKAGVRLSPEGQELLERLRAVTDAADALERDAESIRKRSISALRVGAFSSIARHWLPEIVAQFQTLSPDVTLSVSMEGIAPLYAAVKNDEIDVAMVSYQSGLCQGLGWIPIWNDELLAILPESHPAQGESFPVEGFDGQDFLMPSQGFEMDIAPVFASASHRVTPTVHHTNMDDASIASMVEHDLGVSVLSRLVMEDMKYRVKALPLEPKAYRSLGIIFKERRSGDKNIRRLVSCTAGTVSVKYGLDRK